MNKQINAESLPDSQFHQHPQGVLPFPELTPVGSPYKSEEFPKQSSSMPGKDSAETLLMHKDPTLMFMTMAVTMTQKHEMPIVRAYRGRIPSDIRGLHRVSRDMLHVAPHFYFDDSKILEYWNNPFKTAELLAQFPVSIGMDFSMTNEMTRPQKIFASFLNKLWVAWLQSQGVACIPNISFPDEWEQDYWLEGWPTDSIIAVSSVGVLRHGNPSGWLKGMERIRKELRPIHILRYGSEIPGENNNNCTYFKNDNNRSAYGWK